jgi:single-strand DNA-binding protein
MHITVVSGRLGGDPELRYTPDGKPVCNFSMASKNRGYTTWFKVAVWGKNAENCNQYLVKGQQVTCTGRVAADAYKARDGEIRSVLQLNAYDVEFGPKPAGAERQSGGQDDYGEPIGDGYDDEEIPF